MLLYDTVVRQKGGRFSVLAVIYTYYCGAFFLPSHSANAHLVLADAIAHSMWPKQISTALPQRPSP